MFDFINISVIDIIDIILVGLLIYQMVRIMRGTSVFNIFTGILLLYLTWIVVKALNMKLLSSILGQILGVGVIALIVIFQPEIRRFLLHIGSRYLSSRNNKRQESKPVRSACAVSTTESPPQNENPLCRRFPLCGLASMYEEKPQMALSIRKKESQSLNRLRKMR